MNTAVRSIESVAENYSKSLLERGFNKGNLRTIKPFHTTGLCFTNRIILGLVISGNLEVQTSLSVNHFVSDEEFLLPANLHFQVSAGILGAVIFFARQKFTKKFL